MNKNLKFHRVQDKTQSSGQKYDAKYDQRPNNTSDYSAAKSPQWDKDYRGDIEGAPSAKSRRRPKS